MFLGSDLVKDEVPEEDNDTLLSHFCRFFVSAWGKGIAARRKNAIVGRSEDYSEIKSGTEQIFCHNLT